MTSASELSEISKVHDLIGEIRQHRLVVHNMTNQVAMTLSANVLLALGASPVMTIAEEEIDDWATNAAALVVNVGTALGSHIPSMKLAVSAYTSKGKPWVLDPVGVGATAFRNRSSSELASMGPTIIRANANEVIALAGLTATEETEDETSLSHGSLDASEDSGRAIRAAQKLAAFSKGVVVVTGQTDYVTDGQKIVSLDGGSKLIQLSTATGCALSATIAAFLPFTSALMAGVSGCAVYKAATKLASMVAAGPGDMPHQLCNAIHNLTVDKLADQVRITEIY